MKFIHPAIFLTVFCLGFLCSVDSEAQIVTEITDAPSSLRLDSGNRLPGSQLLWEPENLPETGKVLSDNVNKIYSFSESTIIPFTGLAIGWKIEGNQIDAHHFHLEIRSRVAGEEWPGWVHTYGYLNPEDSPSGLYWAMLYVTESADAHNEFEFRITSPSGSAISSIQVTAADARSDQAGSVEKYYQSSADPEMPDIITREGWWGDLPPSEREPSYTPTQIDITHAAVHHTVTSNSPPDPPLVVRQIWDWHVNDNGWLDIGYNFLIDHDGNIYQGRHNPWLETTDVRGAHAGNANSRSVGIALLGQFEPGANPQVGNPESVALDALVKIISWRFTQKNIDPMAEASIPVNPSGSRILPTIMGHRDVSATACPGANLYTLLPDIRSSTDGGTGENGDGDDEEVITGPFRLYQNYPNPFRGETTIPYMLEQTRDVRIELYTVNGNHIRTLYSGSNELGEREVQVSLEGLSSGVYFYELITRDFRQMKQMIYIR
jgi:hypothetical protein